MKISTVYMLDEYHKFRGIMCSTAYDREQKLKAWEGLLYVYVQMKVEETEADQERAEMIATAMHSLVMELSMRLGLEMTLVTKQIEEAEDA